MRSTNFVNIAVCGKFHLLNYIAFLEKTSVLNRVYFSHKPGTASRFGISSAVANNYPVKELLTQGHARLFGDRFMANMSSVYASLWESMVLSNWDSAPVLHVVANGNCSSIVERAKKEGAFVLAEAINTHPQNWKEILAREAERWGFGAKAKDAFLSESKERRQLREMEMADALLAPTQIVSDSFVSRGFAKPVYKIPYAANLSRFYRDTEATADFDAAQNRRGPLKIICVGQIGLRKGQFYLLEAVRRLGPENVSLTLVGTVGSYVQETLKKYAGEFQHIERVPSGNMREVLLSHDVFVLASLEEGLSVSVCEAMACGLAVVTTREAGGEEIIEDNINGFLVDAGSVDVLEEQLARLVRDRDTVFSVGQCAANATKDYHNWDQYATRLEAVYRTCYTGTTETTNASERRSPLVASK